MRSIGAPAGDLTCGDLYDGQDHRFVQATASSDAAIGGGPMTISLVDRIRPA
jgi:hypothetical protein